MFRIVQMIIILASFIFLVGCDRPENDDSKVSISIPKFMTSSNKVSAQSNPSVLGRVIINVSGGGAGLNLYTWDAHGENDSIKAAPESHSFPVAKGSGRLVQVLAVYMDTSTMEMKFYYGESKVDVNSSDVRVSLPISNVATSKNVSGRLTGRYALDSLVFPTGILEVRYKAPSGNSMVIDTTSIVSGWFSALILSDVAFDYVIASGAFAGHKMFGQGINSSSSVFLTAGEYASNALRMDIPLSKRDGDTESARRMIWGYFSDGSIKGKAKISGKLVYRDSLTGSSSRLKKFDNSVSLNYTHVPNVAALETVETITNPTVPYGLIEFTGGASAPGDVFFEDYITVSPDQVENGNDNAAPFVGALRILQPDEGKVTGELNSQSFVQLVPGGEVVIDRIAAFALPESAAFQPNFDNPFPCQSPPSVLIKVPTTRQTADASKFNLDTSPLANVSVKAIGFCFYKGTTQVANGFWRRMDEGGNPQNQSPYLRFEVQNKVTEVNDEVKLRTGGCYPVVPRLYLWDGVSSSPWAPTAGSVQISSNDLISAQDFYRENTCTTKVSIIDNYTFNTGTSDLGPVIWMKNPSPVNQKVYSISLIDSTGEGVTSSVTNHQKFTFLKQTLALEISEDPNNTMPSCIQAKLRIVNEFNNHTSESAVQTYSNLPIQFGYSLLTSYSNNCSSPLSVIAPSISEGSSEVTFSFQRPTNEPVSPQPSGTIFDPVYMNTNFPGLAFMGFLSNQKLGELNGGVRYIGANISTSDNYLYDYYLTENSSTSAYTTGYNAGADLKNGSGNTALLLGTSQAAAYCDSLVHGGFSDWYLPAKYEMYLLSNMFSLNNSAYNSLNFGSEIVWTSSFQDSGSSYHFDPGTRTIGASVNGISYKVRCMRKVRKL